MESTSETIGMISNRNGITSLPSRSAKVCR